MHSPIYKQADKNQQTQRGFSLVELMIAITIGLLILAALSTLFVNQSRTRAELDKSNRMIDNGRYAMEVLSENLKLAGYYDNYVPSGTPTATPDPCTLATITDSTTNLNVLLHHIQGYNAATQASQITALPTACGFTYTAGSPSTIMAGSDILVLRRASTSIVAASAAVATTTYLQVSNCSTETVKYQIALGSAAFTAYHKKDCSAAADLRPFIVQIYFVAPYSIVDATPTLKRMELDATGAFVITPLVEGIEYMQIDYGIDGIDTNADGVPDRFNTADIDGAADAYTSCSACTAEQWANVVSVKINIIARNLETTTGYTDTKTYSLGDGVTYTPAAGDHYKRHAYTQVVRLVNPSSRRETP